VALYSISLAGNHANVAVDRLAQAHAEQLSASVKQLSIDRYMAIDSGANTMAKVDEQVIGTRECLLSIGFKPKFAAHSEQAHPVNKPILRLSLQMGAQLVFGNVV
jgi:hypothetical protein